MTISEPATRHAASPSEAVRTGILDAVGEAAVSFTPELVGFIRFG